MFFLLYYSVSYASIFIRICKELQTCIGTWKLKKQTRKGLIKSMLLKFIKREKPHLASPVVIHHKILKGVPKG